MQERVYGVVSVQELKSGVMLLTIPQEAREELGIKKGDKMMVVLTAGGLCYRARKG